MSTFILITKEKKRRGYFCCWSRLIHLMSSIFLHCYNLNKEPHATKVHWCLIVETAVLITPCYHYIHHFIEAFLHLSRSGKHIEILVSKGLKIYLRNIKKMKTIFHHVYHTDSTRQYAIRFLICSRHLQLIIQVIFFNMYFNKNWLHAYY